MPYLPSPLSSDLTDIACDEWSLLLSEGAGILWTVDNEDAPALRWDLANAMVG